MLVEARRAAKFQTHDMLVASRLRQIVTQADWRMQDVLESYNMFYLDENECKKKSLLIERIKMASLLHQN